MCVGHGQPLVSFCSTVQERGVTHVPNVNGVRAHLSSGVWGHDPAMRYLT